ncbi:pentapeptide repeat-containing protein [Actinomadura fulvescens]|uniref:Pentapeptide repeat-containing protein n=1 Tax=Actinomadura fulvescens TaxID=46160 RepID=A0ABN3QW26_9ACTN
MIPIAGTDEDNTSPATRRRARVKRPTQQELDALPADRRLELINHQRQSRHQNLNSVGILFGVVFTVASLVATALTLRTTQEGQITERYTKAAEQLGSKRREVRTAAIHALGRIADDSARDHNTVMDLLASYVRERDPGPKAKLPHEPHTDVQAALTVLGRRPRVLPGGRPLDLHNIRTPGIQLARANLRGANLTGANLNQADLTGADLRGANLIGANLKMADLRGAHLVEADLIDADLRGAGLSGAHLRGADLSPALLHGAVLSGADLSGADLGGADLSGADLRGVHGVSADEIRRIAITDSATRL